MGVAEWKEQILEAVQEAILGATKKRVEKLLIIALTSRRLYAQENEPMISAMEETIEQALREYTDTLNLPRQNIQALAAVNRFSVLLVLTFLIDNPRLNAKFRDVIKSILELTILHVYKPTGRH